jgi:glycosyltransferase involved in cell wall biosynthesis
MKVFAILTTNNESDILHDCLLSALCWADKVFVMDTGSTDATPDILSKMSEDHQGRIFYYKSEFREYNFIKTNNELFRHFFHFSEIGDWWCTLSTDEFFGKDTRLMLSRIPPEFNCVWDIRINFYFTEKDLESFVATYGKDYLSDMASMHSFYKTLNYYKADYSEPRFFRHNKCTLSSTLFLARNFNRIWYDRAVNFHYQYRHPSQILRRVATRKAIYSRTGYMKVFSHENNFAPLLFRGLDSTSVTSKSLQERIVDSSYLNKIRRNSAGIDASSPVISFSELPLMPYSSIDVGTLLLSSIRARFRALRVSVLARSSLLLGNIISLLPR